MQFDWSKYGHNETGSEKEKNQVQEKNEKFISCEDKEEKQDKLSCEDEEEKQDKDKKKEKTNFQAQKRRHEHGYKFSQSTSSKRYENLGDINDEWIDDWSKPKHPMKKEQHEIQPSKITQLKLQDRKENTDDEWIPYEPPFKISRQPIDVCLKPMLTHSVKNQPPKNVHLKLQDHTNSDGVSVEIAECKS